MPSSRNSVTQRHLVGVVQAVDHEHVGRRLGTWHDALGPHAMSTRSMPIANPIPGVGGRPWLGQAVEPASPTDSVLRGVEHLLVNSNVVLV